MTNKINDGTSNLEIEKEDNPIEEKQSDNNDELLETEIIEEKSNYISKKESDELFADFNSFLKNNCDI